jgi:anthranilate synthase component 2
VKILLVDFYDSFTYNLAHYLAPMCQTVDVVRDNLVDLENITNYDKIVLSPGPGLPEETRHMHAILNRFTGEIPILGICLGMQGIAQHIGGKLSPKKTILHGKPVELTVKNHSLLFHQIPSNFSAGLYHSWEVKLENENSKLITSVDEYNVIMSIEIPDKKLYGVQFHPESILTENGKRILQNFIELS